MAAESARERDPERTRAEILEVATREFATHGYAGARVDDMAALMRTTKRMIYYYFGSKEQLFVAVLEHAYTAIRRAERQVDVDGLDPASAIRRVAELTFDHHGSHPEFLRLVSIENIHRAEHMAKSPAIAELGSPAIDLLAEILERGRKDGTFRGGIDPLQLYVSIAGLSYFYLSNSHTLSAIFGRDLLAAKAKSERLNHMTDVILSYVLRS